MKPLALLCLALTACGGTRLSLPHPVGEVTAAGVLERWGPPCSRTGTPGLSEVWAYCVEACGPCGDEWCPVPCAPGCPMARFTFTGGRLAETENPPGP